MARETNAWITLVRIDAANDEATLSYLSILRQFSQIISVASTLALFDNFSDVASISGRPPASERKVILHPSEIDST